MMSFNHGYKFSVAITLALSVVLGHVGAQAPDPSDPSGMAMGGLPGEFPTTVTAANIQVDQFTPATIDGSNSNNLRVTFPAMGPIPWTSSRHNEGDLAISIGPGDPADASYYPPNDFVDNYAPLENGPFQNSTVAWRLARQTGAALATVRHNGVDRGPDFTNSGSAVGTIHGIAYFNVTGAQGWGFQMDTGEFQNGGGSSPDLQMGIAGFGTGEASFDVGTAYFPYEEGWIGAWVDRGIDGESTFNAGTPDLPVSVVNYASSVATVSLPDVDSASDGMLFVAPTNDNNETKIAAAFPDAGGWTVSVRQNDDITVSGDASSLTASNEFQFLYMPYSATNLIGGHVDGRDANLINSSGSSSFSVSRSTAGEYALSVFDTDGTTKLTEDDGMLILSVAGSMDGQPTLADRSFLSYEYDGTSGDFVINANQVTAANSPTSANVFGDLIELQDADFYFAWIDFENPVTLGAVAGAVCDADGDGDCQVDDLDAMYSQFGTAGSFDFDGNGTVGPEDIDGWLAAASTPGNAANPDGNTYVSGDVNFSGTVDSTDLGALLNNFNNGAGVGWGGGDLNGDNQVDSTDLGSLLNNFGFPTSSTAAVPEPSTQCFAFVGLLILAVRLRRRSH